ncbi:helix-turn-helix domain-containing protein [Actinacidiphila sp. ITFR-21]|uniref:helix-turn-helix domain-containing protein n=1 Tax=Actinacidiphila sp. ITFR-21 TaxID=3075199 RepID=UPI00288A2839|nr:helix-turn-helix domain-containing protein [Streptomyces sp. ITFR-21]WNI19138.1 helix-turn-helix domain-containing protein [Streptomyces sp. ITFR-21]
MSATVVPATIEEKWRARTVPVDGGHLMWTGAPDMRWQGGRHKASHVAFTIRTGRQPVGYVRPDCGMRGCVLPEHVDDQPGRQRTRAQLRTLRGLGDRPALCAQGHHQDVHGRLDQYGKAYCNVCSAIAHANSVGTGHGRIGTRHHGADRWRVALDVQARYYAGGSIRGIALDIGRTYRYVYDLLVLTDTRLRPRGYHREFHATTPRRQA